MSRLFKLIGQISRLSIIIIYLGLTKPPLAAYFKLDAN